MQQRYALNDEGGADSRTSDSPRVSMRPKVGRVKLCHWLTSISHAPSKFGRPAAWDFSWEPNHME